MRIQYANAHLWYNGGTISVQRRLANGLQLGSTFTYSKTEDEGSGVTSGGDELPQSQRGIYAWDLHLKRGPSAYDIRKVFSANFAYELPFGKNRQGFAGALIRGWQVNSVITLSDGYALSVQEESATQTTRIGDDEDLRPDLIPGGNPNPGDRRSRALVRCLAVHSLETGLLRDAGPRHGDFAGPRDRRPVDVQKLRGPERQAPVPDRDVQSARPGELRHAEMTAFINGVENPERRTDHEHPHAGAADAARGALDLLEAHGLTSLFERVGSG